LEVTVKVTQRASRAFAAIVTTALLLTACTPEQLAKYSDMTGHQLSEADHAVMLSLPDHPMRVGAQVIQADGTVLDDPVALVNSLPYSYQSKAPVLDAFRIVTASRGWTTEQTASWEVAMWDIALKEAQGCWNVRYGARFAHWDGRGCILRSAGRGASGYGQITSVLHPVTCEMAGLCSGPAIVSSPWTSMLALVVVIERHGVKPYCYDSFSRSFHRTACSNPGLDVG
jgi:hypothetical protein